MSTRRPRSRVHAGRLREDAPAHPGTRAGLGWFPAASPEMGNLSTSVATPPNRAHRPRYTSMRPATRATPGRCVGRPTVSSASVSHVLRSSSKSTCDRTRTKCPHPNASTSAGIRAGDDLGRCERSSKPARPLTSYRASHSCTVCRETPDRPAPSSTVHHRRSPQVRPDTAAQAQPTPSTWRECQPSPDTTVRDQPKHRHASPGDQTSKITRRKAISR